MTYTHAGGKVDKKIQNKLDVIIDSIRQKIPSTISVILAGSFGYGQGAVKVEGDEVYPFNDFDIYVISGEKVSKKLFDNIATDISQELNLKGINYFYKFAKEEQRLKENFYIDLKIYTLEEWKNLLPRIRYYKLKENTKILWGEDVRGLAPSFSLRQIPVAESVKILLDRSAQLVEYYSDDKNKYCQDYLTYIIQQAYAGCLTALLLPLGKYEPRYVDSARVLSQIYKDIPLSQKLPDLEKRIGEFIKWRMNPQELPAGNVKDNWRCCAKDVLAVLSYTIGNFVKKEINNVDELSYRIRKMSSHFHRPYLNELVRQKLKVKINFVSYFLLFPLNIFFKYKYFLRVKKLSGKYYFRIFLNSDPPDLKILSIAPLLLSAKINGYDLDKIRLELKKLYPGKGNDWDELSLDYANAYIAFFLQKII
jgi:hypothetical protein